MVGVAGLMSPSPIAGLPRRDTLDTEIGLRRGGQPARDDDGSSTVAVLGDIHGNTVALDAVLKAVATDAPATIVCTGDLVNYGPDPAGVIHRLLAATSVCVADNHDRLLAHWRGLPLAPRPGRDMRLEATCLRWTAAHIGGAERELLQALPQVLVWPLGNRKILLAHGSPASVDEYILPECDGDRWRQILVEAGLLGASVVALGHTHIPLQRRWQGRLLCNPGSVGWPKDGDPRAAYGRLRFHPEADRPAEFTIHRVTYDAPAVADAMVRAGLPPEVAAAIEAGRPASQRSPR